jgi:hypothetical protein
MWPRLCRSGFESAHPDDAAMKKKKKSMSLLSLSNEKKQKHTLLMEADRSSGRVTGGTYPFTKASGTATLRFLQLVPS